jgi:PAS domain-containing protein
MTCASNTKGANKVRQRRQSETMDNKPAREEQGGLLLPEPSLDMICQSAARLMDMPSAMLFLNQNDMSRMIASYGLPLPLRNLAWSFDSLPFKAGDVFVVTDASKNPFAMATLAEFGLSINGSMIRLPVDVQDNHVLALYLFADRPIRAPGAERLKQLDVIAQQARSQFRSVEKLLVDASMNLNIPRTLEDMTALIEALDQPAALFDDKLKIHAGNAGAAQILGGSRQDMIGKRHADFAPLQAEAVEFMFRQALQTRKSAPDFEIVIEPQDSWTAARRVIRYSVTPFSPINQPDAFLFVTATVVSHDNEAAARPQPPGSKARLEQETPDAAQAFLLDTLITRRTIRHRNAISYLTLRTWRQPIRTYQINAFKALKQKLPASFPQSIVADMSEYLQQFIGLSAFKAIVPVPCGHSNEGSCLSLEIARHLSAEVKIPVVQAFLRQPHKGSSHPKQNTRRPPMILQREITEPVLLVDDVATSGAHIEEAIKLLRPACGTVLAVAWIGSDSAKS